MPAVQYPFIDIAVHERVRDHFGRGEAMALFSMDLQTALWANGRGAALFGTPMIYDFLERGPRQQDVTFRQFSATAARLAKTGDSGQFNIRIHSGFKSVSVMATAQIIEPEPGQPAILFTAPIDAVVPSLQERARRMIEGFDDPDIHLAVLDADSKVLAASQGFSALGITPVTTRTLVAMASGQPGKLVKRPVPAGKGYLPAAAGQLSQDPQLNLLFVVETVIGTLDPSAEFTQTRVEPATQLNGDLAVTVLKEDVVDEPIADAVNSVEDIAHDVNDLEAVPEPQALDEPDTTIPETVIVEAEADVDVMPSEEEITPVEAVQTETTVSDEAEPEPVAVADTVALEDAATSPVEDEAGFTFDSSRRASRFVWKIDAAGRFSSVSHEFADAVGPKAANVEGMSFADLAALFNLDPDGKITELLNRRDTWSGKTIYWPVEGTSLMVPIDLAALPTYTRSREFDGFRGFGIVRITDAVEDPNAVGLALAGEEQPAGDELADTVADDFAAVTPVSPEDVKDDATAPLRAMNENIAEDERPEAQRSFDPPETEVPVLEITETPNRRSSDKVVQFENHRAKNREGLSASEQAAFQEIGRALTPVVTDEKKTQHDETDSPEHIDDAASDAEPITTDETLQQELFTADSEQSADVSFHDDDDDFAAYTRGDENVTFIAPQSVARASDADAPVEAHIAPRTIAALNADTIDQMPVALLIHSGDRLIHANPEFLRLTGYGTIEELAEVGGLDALLQRDDLDAVSQRSGGLVAVSAENELIPVKARLQSVSWDEAGALMLSLIPMQEPAANHVPANENDVQQPTSDETDAEVSGLKGQVEELHSILETATDGVVLLDEGGTIRSLNRSANALFNYDNDEISGKPFVMLFAHESQRAVLDYLSGLANNGVASVLNDGREVIGREASGGFLPLFMTIGRLKSSNGYCAVIRDITQWKRTEEDLRNAKRAAETANAHKTDFLARVSHEIRTPLNAIIGFAELMATERFGPVGHPRYVEYSNDIGRSGRHVLDIVNDLLDISKIEAGQMDVDFKAVALNDTIAEAVSIVQPQANNQRVIIRTALSQSVPQIVADLRSIKQIMLNVLSNAIKFTPSGGQIVVSTAYEANGSVVLRIRDTGIGMTRTELEHAMKPFRQVSASSNRVRGDGTGLGLPLTKAMVDANRANFSITSAPNEGTLVEISFPSQRVLAN